MGCSGGAVLVAAGGGVPVTPGALAGAGGGAAGTGGAGVGAAGGGVAAGGAAAGSVGTLPVEAAGSAAPAEAGVGCTDAQCATKGAQLSAANRA